MTGRYTMVAPVYDVLSGEWPVYGIGRRIGIPLLRLRPGDTVLDVGCGTGLNVPMIGEAVGAAGVVVGVDASAQMLAAARRRRKGGAAPALRLWRRDATDLGRLDGEEPALVDGADAVLFTYSLSLMHPWQDAWEGATALARPGARVLVVDMAVPTGPARGWAPLTRLACRLGGADITAHPWQALARECDDVLHREARGGHVQVWAGTLRGRPRSTGSARPHGHLLTSGSARPTIPPDDNFFPFNGKSEDGPMSPTPAPPAVPTAFNALPAPEARSILLSCLGVGRWADDVAAGRPYASVDAVLAAAADAADELSEEELEAALSGHPRIGERASSPEHQSELSEREQAGVDPDDHATAAALAAGNAAYEGRFDRVFLIRAAGRSAPDILTELRRRLTNDDQAERTETVTQLREIAVLRLKEML